jgi:CSLREA domain-containing protein
MPRSVRPRSLEPQRETFSTIRVSGWDGGIQTSSNQNPVQSDQSSDRSNMGSVESHLNPATLDPSRHSSDLSRHSSDLSRHSSDLSRHSSDLSRHSSDLSRHSSDLSRHWSDLSRHSSDLSRHSSDLSRHSSDLSRHSSDLGPFGISRNSVSLNKTPISEILRKESPLSKSAKRTSENSPAVQCWVTRSRYAQSVKRTVDQAFTGKSCRIQPSVSRTAAPDRLNPTDESAGYYQSSATPTGAAEISDILLPRQRVSAVPTAQAGRVRFTSLLALCTLLIALGALPFVSRATGLNASTSHLLSDVYAKVFGSRNARALSPVPPPAGATFMSSGSGNWNASGSWTLVSGSDADGIPDSDDDAFIQAGHIITLTQTEAVNDLHISTGTADATTGGDGRVALAANTLQINGKIRCYFAAVGTTPGTSSTTLPGSPITITAASAGKISFVGSSRNITNTGEWAGNNTGATTTFAVEINLTSGQTATMQTSIKASSWNITAGTLDAQDVISADNGTTGQGDVTIAATATVTSNQTGTTNSVIQRGGSTAAGTLTVNGSLQLTGSAPTIAVTTVAFNGTVEYSRSGNQTLAAADNSGVDLTTYTNIKLSGSGTKTTVASKTTSIAASGSVEMSGGATPPTFAVGASGTYSVSATGTTIKYTATGVQTTGTEWDANFQHANINNGAGVTLSASKTVSGTLTLTTGQFTISSNLTMNPGATISRAAGSLSGTPNFNGIINLAYTGSTGVTTGTEVPTGNVNLLTINNSGGVTLGSNLTSDNTNTVSSGASFSTGAFTYTEGGGLTNSGTINVSSGGKLVQSSLFTNSGTTNVAGTFQLNSGAQLPSGNALVYSSGSTLLFNNTSGGDGYLLEAKAWPASNGPTNVTLNSGTAGITLNAARTVSGTFQYAAGVSGASNLTLNGTAQVNNGGFLSGSPTYGSSSLLKYNTGGTYGRNGEWIATTSGAGYPANVQISNSTTLDADNGGTFNSAGSQIAGNLTIDPGSALSMGSMTKAITVLGNIANSGTLTLSTVSLGDLNVKGNLTTTTYTSNGRTLTFSGGSAQTWTDSAGGQNFGAVVINNSSTGVTLNSATSASTLTLTNGKVMTTAGNLLSVTNTSSSAISGGSSSSYVNGPLKRAFPAALGGSSTYAFPVGKGGFNQFEMINPATTGATAITVEVSDTSTGGSAGTGLSAINSNRYWQAASSGAFTNTKVRLTDASVSANNLIGKSETLNGVYNSVGGSVSGSTITSDPVSSFSYFVIGTSAGNTISGTLFDTNGNPVTGGRTIKLIQNGTVSGTTATTDNITGIYTFSGLTLVSGDKIATFVDGASEKGVTATLIGTPADINNFDIKASQLTIRSDNGGSPANTNSDLANSDSTKDPDIPFTVSGGTTLTTTAGTSVLIFGGSPASAYAPGGDINDGGDWTNNGTFTAGAFVVKLNGTSNQAIGGLNNSFFATLTINPANNATVFIKRDETVTTALNVSTGILDQGASASDDFTLITNTVTVASGATWQNLGKGDVKLAGNVANSGSIIFNANGNGCPDADDILIRSSDISGVVGTTQRTWSGTGTFSMTDVDVDYQKVPGGLTLPLQIIANDSTDGTHNSGWIFTNTCNGPYTWIGGPNQSWIVPANWSPVRPTAANPTTTDVLIFDGAVTPSPTISNVPTQTNAAIKLKNGVFVTLNATTGGATLTLNGGSGADLDVPSGTLLTLSGADPIVISLTASGHECTVAGQLLMQGGAHQLLGKDGGLTPAITMTGSNAFTTDSTYSSSTHPFGTSNTTGIVVFQSGATAAFHAGLDPFGGAGKSVTTFNLGSIAKFFTASAFDIDGRTYGYLTLDGNQTYNGSGTGATTVLNTFEIETGSNCKLSGSAGGDLILQGSFLDQNTVAAFNPNGRTVKFNGGNTTQTISKLVGNAEPFFDVEINETAGGKVRLLCPVTINGKLNLSTADSVLELNQNILNLNGTVDSARAGNLKGDGSARLNIGGSGALGTLNFLSGSQTLFELTMDRSSSGTAVFGNDMSVGSNLGLTNGTVDMGAFTLDIGNSSVSRSNGYVIGNLKKNFPAQGSKTFEVGTLNGYSPVDVNIPSLNFSSLVFTVSATGTKHPNIPGTNALSRYWTVTPNITSGFTADLSFHYLAGDVVGTESNYKVFKYSGGVFTQPANQSVDAGTHTANVTGVSSFSDWTLAEPGSVNPPTLGDYPNTASVELSGNTTVAPTGNVAPTNTTSIDVSTTTNFKGTFAADPTTGVVTVTDAHPAGNYTVTVTAFNQGTAPASKTFTLTVTTPLTCNPVTFASGTNIGTGSESHPVSVAIGDFNGDGKQDLVTANKDTNNVSVSLGDVPGSFTAANTFDTGSSPRSVAVGDFNGDGKPDLAVANFGSDNVSILLGDGSGNFGAPVNFGVGSKPQSVVIGDFNGDGRQDLAVANSNSANVSILLGNGAGSFAAVTNFTTGAVGSSPVSIALGDFNGPGGTGDGKQDIVVVNNLADQGSVLFGDGTGGFGTPISFDTGSQPLSVAVGDFNGDGRQDLVVANNGSDDVSVLLNDGTGGFPAAASISAPQNPQSVAVGDFNGDEKQDIVTANFNSNDVSVLLNNGSGGFLAATNFGAGTSNPVSVVVGDFNNDGKQDLATASISSNDISVLLRGCPTPTNPSGVGAANPDTLVAGGSTVLTVTVTPGTNPPSTGITVTGDLTSIGGSATQQFFDDGVSGGDVTAGDNVFTYNATVAMTTTTGGKTLPVSIADAQARNATTNISLTVVDCASGLTNCGGICFDLSSDNNNCGTCGNVCGAGTHCSGGGCVPDVSPSPSPAPSPEIAVEQPAGNDLISGSATVGFGSSDPGVTGSTLTFTIRNTGPGPLTISDINTNSSDEFVVDASQTTLTVASNDSTTFKVTFTPNGVQTRTTQLQIINNDADEGSFTITLTGTGNCPAGFVVNSTSDDSDIAPGDGRCDVDQSPGDQCTLRAALEETNALHGDCGALSISFNIPVDDLGHVYYKDDGVPNQVTPANVTHTSVTNDADLPTSGLLKVDDDYKSSWWRIQPTGDNGALPAIEYPVTIDGYTQGANTPLAALANTRSLNDAQGADNAVLRIELDGESIDSFADGFELYSNDSCTIRGLVINGFQDVDIYVEDGGGDTFAGNFIGVDVSGTLADGTSATGIYIDSGDESFIGGEDPGDRNLISGRLGDESAGIAIFADSTSVEGNLIGADRTGARAIPNAVGVYIGGDSNFIGCEVIDGDNVISGNRDEGVLISDASINVVEGNFIGTDNTGQTALPNSDGVKVTGFYAQLNFIGIPGLPNTISGNGRIDSDTHQVIGGQGVEITDSASGNFVDSNLIGVAFDGATPLGNLQNGVEVYQGAVGNIIGPVFLCDCCDCTERTAKDTGSLAKAAQPRSNQAAVNPTKASQARQEIQSKLEQAMANRAKARQTRANQAKTSQLKPGPGQGNQAPANNAKSPSSTRRTAYDLVTGGNVIAFNGLDGVRVTGNSDVNNQITQNSIFSNGALGINLVADGDPTNGVTDNDVNNDDADSGPNNLQNFPKINKASVATGVINFDLDSCDEGPYTIEFFKNPSGCDPSLHGEGEIWIGSTGNLSSGPNQNSDPMTFDYGDVITATATDYYGNTSEFSLCFLVPPKPTVGVSVSPAAVLEDSGNTLVYTFTRDQTAGSLTVNFDVGGTATFGGGNPDYNQSGAAPFTSSSGNVTFADGSPNATVTVTPIADTNTEPHETVVLTVTSGTGYNVAPNPGNASATGTITNDDCPTTFVVNSVADTDDANPGDGHCDIDSGTGGDQCTLRAAIQEANALASCGAINIDLNGVSGAINLLSVLPAIDHDVNLKGTGANVLTVQRNSASGFRIFNINPNRVVSILGLTIQNGADATGGGFYNNGGSLTVDGCEITGNSATSSGGGIYSSPMASGTATLVITNSTLSNNSSGVDGGGVDSDSALGTANLTLTNCTVSGNTTKRNGGGVSVVSSPATLTNVTITNNHADNDNSGGLGGGLAESGANVTLHNTLVAGNFRGSSSSTRDDVNGALQTSSSYNLIGDSSGMTGISNGNLNNQVGAAGNPIIPYLGLLINNGGPTRTHGLLYNSPAIDAGDDTVTGSPLSLTSDQRGLARPSDGDLTSGSHVDIGAYERQATESRAVSGGSTVQILLNDARVTFPCVPAGGCIGGESKRDRQASAIAPLVQSPAVSIKDIDPATQPAPPSGFVIGNSSSPPLPAFDLSTTSVTYDGPVTLCFYLPIVTDQIFFDGIRLFHNNGSSLDLLANQSRDFPSRLVCGETNSLSPFVIGHTVTPTAANGSVGGQVLDSNGAPVEGAAVRMGGTQNRLTITDAEGNYHFDNVETNGFYVVTPSRANFSFNPAQRSFSQLAAHTDAVFTGTPTGAILNPLDATEYFVRQQYLDFLGREPDESGFNFWVNNIESCGNDLACREVKRIDTSAAFFLSIEFQHTGFLVYRAYEAAYGDLDSAPVPLSLREFTPDAQKISNGVVVLQSGWQQKLETNNQSFMNQFVQRTRFAGAYPTSMTPAQFVDKLFATARVESTDPDYAASLALFGAATDTSDLAARAQVLRRLAENTSFTRRQFNHAFVLMEYFGYLRRDPNTGRDTDFSGYEFWRDKLNSFNGNFENAEMVKAFLSATEYRGRFPR